MVRLGNSYRGFTIKRILADRVVLLRGDVKHEVRLSGSPFYVQRAPGERRGEPAGIIIAPRSPREAAPVTPTRTREPARPAVTAAVTATPAPAKKQAPRAPAALPEPAKKPAPAARPAPVKKPAPVALKVHHKKPAAPGTAPVSGKRRPVHPADTSTPARPAAAARTPARTTATKKLAVSMPRVRGEVSDFFRRKVAYRGTFSSAGMSLTGVAPGSLLHRMGLRDGDKVASLNGWKLVSSDAAMDAYLSLQSGTQVDVVYSRGGKSHVLSIRLV